MSEATLLDSVTFDEWIKSHDGIVLFHKKLCPHCKVMRTVLGKATSIPKNSRISWPAAPLSACLP